MQRRRAVCVTWRRRFFAPRSAGTNSAPAILSHQLFRTMPDSTYRLTYERLSRYPFENDAGQY